MLFLRRRGAVLMTLLQLSNPLCALRAGEVYKSIDAEGHVVYSDRAPTSTAEKSLVRVDQPDPAEVARNAKEQAILSAEDAQRKKEQEAALERAAGLVRPGGRIAYVTCSLLDEENGGQVRGFIARHGGYAVLPPEEVVTVLGDRADAFRAAMFASPEGLLMTPHHTGTDGFFVAVMARQ